LHAVHPLTIVKWFFFVLSVASVLYAGLLLVLSEPNIKQATDLAALQAGVKVVNPDMTEYDGEQQVWRLKAKIAEEHGDVVKLDSPHLTMLLDTGQTMPVRAAYGEYHQKKQVIFLQGSVVVRYQEWDLSSEEMFYRQKTGELIAPKDFVLQQEGMVVTGRDLHIFRHDGKVQVLQGVHMNIDELP